MSAYYNENDPAAAEWLRELIKEKLIVGGDVDERSIEDVTPADVAGYRQCHFFAGIGGWSYALRLAGWPDDAPVWTGSCPCQPFSQAGARLGVDDPRHLWPVWRWLIDQCRPVTIFGEQVASKDGRQWFTGVRTDLDVLGYATGAADLCAAGVGAPHIRQRLFWVGRLDESEGTGRRRGRESPASGKNQKLGGPSGDDPWVGNAESERRRRGENDSNERGRQRSFGQTSTDDCLSNTSGGRLGERGAAPQPQHLGHADSSLAGGLRLSDADMSGEHGWPPSGEQSLRDQNDARGYWGDSEWIGSIDGKARRIKPGIEPLVNGLPGRMGLLRGYGNAIVPQVAAEFVKSYL